MSVYLGSSSNSPINIVDMYLGSSSNTPVKIVKAWIGSSNNTPVLFWGGDIIPKMTSNTSPKGIVTASGFIGKNGTISNIYFAFNRTNQNWIEIQNENVLGYIQYDFDSSVSFSRVVVSACKISMSSARNESFTISVECNGQWQTYGSFTITENNGLNYVFKKYTVYNSVSNVTAIRISNDVMKTYGYNVAIADIQAY